jgi:hypothetical protein
VARHHLGDPVASALEEEAMHYLGLAIHSYQDIESHTPEVTEPLMGSDSIPSHGKGVDSTREHPEAFEKTRVKTIRAVEAYRMEFQSSPSAGSAAEDPYERL